MSIKTVLFDLDGTIVDSNELITASFEYTFNEYGIKFTDEEILQCNGPPLLETFYKANPGHEEEMMKVYREFNIGKHEQYIRLFPHVVETIERLLEKDIKIGIVTSKLSDAVKLGMSLTGIDRYFDVVVALDHVTHSKPHPESVLKAMNSLGSKASSTLMIGDNYHDIIAGQRAGVQTAGVNWSQKGAEFLKSYKPTYMLKDMSEILTIVGV